MPDVIIIKEDILADSFTEKVAAIAGCIDLLGFAGCKIKACWTVNIDSVEVYAVFSTPVGDIELGRIILTPANASGKIGGSIRGFKAEVTFEIDFNTFVLKICGKISVPIGGSRRGCTTINL
jgi:hypothetical protein